MFSLLHIWNQDQFEDMLSKWRNEWTGKALGADIFVGQKKMATNVLFAFQVLRSLVVNIDFRMHN